MPRDRNGCARYQLGLSVYIAIGVIFCCACDSRSQPELVVSTTTKLFPAQERGKAVFIDTNGKVRIRIDDATSPGEFSEGLAPAKKVGGAMGFVDRSGKWAIAPKYPRVFPFRDGLARFFDAKLKHGFIRTDGTVAFTCDTAFDFKEGMAIVREGGKEDGSERKLGYVDQTGRVVIPYLYDQANPFKNSYACVQREGKYGFIDKSGKEVTSMEFDYAGDFNEGVAPVSKQGKSGYIDAAGKWVLTTSYLSTGPFSEGLAPVHVAAPAPVNATVGFIDKKGILVIKAEFVDARPFSEGLAAIAVNDADGRRLWGFIDKQGKVVIQPKYTVAFDFRDGLARVFDDKGLYYILPDGTVVWQDS